MNGLKNILRPFVRSVRYLRLYNFHRYVESNPKQFIDEAFEYAFGHKVNWEHPQDINEVIQWLKLYSDTSQWSLFADKYRVREYVKSCGLEHLLVPLYGKWDHVWQINWRKLPERFIMKVNNGSGDTRICRSKKDIDKLEWMSYFMILLHHKIGYDTYEPHYWRIKPCIIAEQLLDHTKQVISSASLIDYKVWCFHGEPKYIWVVINRNKESCDTDMYDIYWNRRSDMCLYTAHYKQVNCFIPSPKNLTEMLSAAKKLSVGVPLVRVDFYEVDSKLYFGEMTMASAGGYNDFFTKDALIEMRDRFYETKKELT